MTLEDWIARMRPHAAAMMLTSISPVRIVKKRPGFGQVIRPVRGAVVASPVPGDYDPEPDYFFHWYRDSALVIDALRLVPDSGHHVRDFVRFSLDLQTLDGRRLPPPQVQPEFRKFLRTDLDAAHGAAIAAETRVNADGTLDIADWPRPQHDGPAIRALALLRRGVTDGESAALLRADLAFVRHHALLPSFDIWEEQLCLHYYGLRVGAAALQAGADWLAAQGDAAFAQLCREKAAAILLRLESYWLADDGFLRSRILPSGRSVKDLDVSVILAANHAGAPPDARLLATLAKLESLFRARYPINRDRAAPALGRYDGDTYYGGGPWYAATLGAAELCYRAGDRDRGDAFLETVRAFTPANGDLSEQFDGTTGAQTSARHLAWSYAALLTALAARDALSPVSRR